MVKGIDIFVDHFRNYTDRYVLIGGTACTFLMEEAGLAFRATKDVDIVLCVETLDAEFVQIFWEFIHLGGYQNRQKSTEKRLFYRFYQPDNRAFPTMLELFSRVPDVITVPPGSHLTPIPIDEEISSLSAILLNEEYYQLIHVGKRVINGVSIVGHEYLIPLKVRAWLELNELQQAGNAIQMNDINKHRSDVFRLFQLLAPDTRVNLPATVHADMMRFISITEEQKVVNLDSLGLHNTSLAEVCEILRTIYGGNY